ncbi:large ribosomal subunit protein uL14m isoform 1-T1 [Phoenicopterus ruber ruber]
MITAIWFVIVPCWLGPGHPGQGWEQNLVLWLATYCPVPETAILLDVVKIHLRGDNSMKFWPCGQFSEFTCNSRRQGQPRWASPPAPQTIPEQSFWGQVTRIQMALLNRRLALSLSHLSSTVIQRHFSITGACRAIQKLTRVRVVDNSALGNTPYHRPPKCIHVYNKTGVGKVGDTILLAIKGEKKKALIVGHKMPGPPMTPRFDSNNVVLIEDNGNPVGTRIKTPIPYILRQREGEFSKVLAIARNFV